MTKSRKKPGKDEDQRPSEKTVRARPLKPETALAEENPEWAVADTAEVTSIKTVSLGENHTLVARPTPHPNDPKRIEEPEHVVTVDDDEEIPESALLSFEETTARPATAPELETESTALDLKEEESVDWKEVATDSPLMRALKDQPTKEDRGAKKRKTKKSLPPETKEEIQRRFEEAKAMLEQKRRKSGDASFPQERGSRGPSFLQSMNSDPPLPDVESSSFPRKRESSEPILDDEPPPPERQRSFISEEFSLGDLWEESGVGQNPADTTAPVETDGNARRGSWLDDVPGPGLKKERTGNLTEGLEEIWTQFEAVKDRHGAKAGADGANGKVVADFSSPYRAHDTLVRAIEAQDLTTFMKAFHRSVLSRMCKGASRRSATGKRRARRVMDTLHGLFKSHGVPTLGKEISDAGKQRLFHYEDPSNPDNTKATYRKEGSVWVLVD